MQDLCFSVYLHKPDNKNNILKPVQRALKPFYCRNLQLKMKATMLQAILLITTFISSWRSNHSGFSIMNEYLETLMFMSTIVKKSGPKFLHNNARDS